MGPIGKILRRIIQRFSDPQFELAYRTGQRKKQAKFTRAMTLIIGVAILVYVATGFLFLKGATLATIGVAQVYFIPVLLGYAWAVARPSYVNSRWIDVFFFALIQPGMYITNMQMVDSGANGWPLSAQFCYSLLLAMSIGCLAFCASVASYGALVILSIFYYYFVLKYHGLASSFVGYSMNSFVTFVAVLFYVNWAIDDKARRVFELTEDLRLERAKSDRLLDNILPPKVAARLREDENETIADDFEKVAVIFADICGFTKLANKLGSRRTVEMLNLFFNRADQGTELFGIEKVKTIGDAYMAVCGALTSPQSPHKSAVDFAVYLIRETHALGLELGLDLRIRIGINTGEVVGGVISTKRLSYDYWGDTINVAARLQGLAEEDGITVSESIYRAVRESYSFHPPRRALLKNLGEAEVYDIDLGQKIDLARAVVR